jgi:hypothetical protein
MLKTFTGYKGKMAAGQAGEIQFVLLAANAQHLQILWASLMSDADPLIPAGIKPGILIEAATLPDAKSGCVVSLTPGFSQVPATERNSGIASTVPPPIDL